jgi:hypothetical protein
MSSIPEEYHKFPDVFSKAKADKPADHRPYDLKIDLEEGAALPLGLIYSLSQREVSLSENLSMNISIWVSSAHRYLCMALRYFL